MLQKVCVNLMNNVAAFQKNYLIQINDKCKKVMLKEAFT